MGWNSRFGASGEAESGDPVDETVINGAPYYARKTVRSSLRSPAAPSDRSDAHIADEIKRRQISLVARYVAAVRARAR
jgi:mono/diheme cytochrome c family protein